MIESTTQSNPFDQYRWENRLVLIFSNNNEQSLADQQVDQFSNQDEELTDRDMLVFIIADGSVMQHWSSEQFRMNTTFIRDEYDVSGNDFHVLLIGKDGGVKLRSRELVAPEQLYTLIDGMPMRRAEMRRKADKG